MKILIVEDDAIIGFLLETELTNAGHQVIGPAASVERGLSLAQATHPDMALVNINLKEGGDGVYLARALLEQHGCPSLFVSGNIDEARKAKDAAIGFVCKPYKPSIVLQSIDVVAQIMNGDRPTNVPSELELFRETQH
jgi:two-component system, response regulator PdtaR